jgi:hypothetical protein
LVQFIYSGRECSSLNINWYLDVSDELTGGRGFTSSHPHPHPRDGEALLKEKNKVILCWYLG